MATKPTQAVFTMLPADVLLSVATQFMSLQEAKNLLVTCKHARRALYDDALCWKTLLVRFQRAHEGSTPWALHGGILNAVPASLIARFGLRRVDIWTQFYALEYFASPNLPSGLLDDEFAECMLYLQRNASLTKVRLTDMLNEGDFAGPRWSIIARLVQLKQLTFVQLDNVRHFNFSAFAPVLRDNNLVWLSLCKCWLGLKPDQCRELSEALAAQPKLVRVDLERNWLDNGAVALLRPAFMQAPSLRVIRVDHNEIGSEGVKMLCDVWLARPDLFKVTRPQPLKLTRSRRSP